MIWGLQTAQGASGSSSSIAISERPLVIFEPGFIPARETCDVGEQVERVVPLRSDLTRFETLVGVGDVVAEQYERLSRPSLTSQRPLELDSRGRRVESALLSRWFAPIKPGIPEIDLSAEPVVAARGAAEEVGDLRPGDADGDNDAEAGVVYTSEMNPVRGVS